MIDSPTSDIFWQMVQREQLYVQPAAKLMTATSDPQICDVYTGDCTPDRIGQAEDEAQRTKDALHKEAAPLARCDSALESYPSLG